MTESAAYKLNGTDRFQLFFDAEARKKTGVGNVIRAVVTLQGKIDEGIFRGAIDDNLALRFLSGIQLWRRWYSRLFHFVNENSNTKPSERLVIHPAADAAALEDALKRDCDLTRGTPLHIDVLYEPLKTVVVISVSHVLMDHAGMELLLATIFGDEKLQHVSLGSTSTTSFPARFRDAVESTFFVAARTAWDLKRLAKLPVKPAVAFETLELSADETDQVKEKIFNRIGTNALPFYLGCSLITLNEHPDLIVGAKDKYFIAVPLAQRSAGNKNVLISNHHSFIYFHAKAGDLNSQAKVSKLFSSQMISQARKKLPEKFSSLMDLFRFLPAGIYRAFIDLPTNGHAGTIAFSLLPDGQTEKMSFGNCLVTGITHYAPVISPPGLNIVFHECNRKLKIILSFDESRIGKASAKALLHTLRKNLLG